MRGIDAVLQELSGGLYDIKIGFDGDIETADAFDTALIVSLFTDARADESEVPEARRRRGWIGNEYTPGIEMGCKLWIPLEQPRLTRSVLNQAQDAARDGLQWFVTDELAVSITDVGVRVEQTGVFLEVTIQRSPNQIERRFYQLWNNTGQEF